MANNKPTKGNTQKPAKSKAQNKLQSNLINSALMIIVVITAAFAYLAIVQRPAINNSNIQAQAQSLVDSQVSIIDQTLSQLRLRLETIAHSAELLAALEHKNDPQMDQSTTLLQFRQELTRAFPEAISSQLISLGPLGIASLNKDSRELRNHIELDLLRRVSNGEHVDPEAYQFQGKWLFSLVEPIEAANKNYANGALLISFDEQYLRTLLSKLDGSLGQTKLIQQFNNKENLITSTGDFTGPADRGVDADTSIHHWQIRFTPSAELIAKSNAKAIDLWLLLALSISVVLIATFLCLKHLRTALNNNLTLLHKRHAASPPFDLPGFEDTAAQLQHKLAAAEAKTTASEQAPTSAEHNINTTEAVPGVPEEQLIPLPPVLPDSIFRAYDIRGLADSELSDEVVYAIGLAIGSEALDQGQQEIIVSADGRNSSPRIHDALVNGLLASGRDIIDIGSQPTPLMYFATHQLSTQSGVMITGSHNPAEYNGIKIVIAGRALSGPAIQALKDRINSNTLSSGQGEYRTQDIEQTYIDYIINDVAIAQPLKIVIDAGNGITGAIAPQLFEELGCEIIPLYCEVDGNFPNHHPDPTIEANLADLKAAVLEHQADLGIAFDGDGDRLGVVTATGQSVAADRLLMLFAQDVVSRNPGADVVFDVKCTRNLNNLISNYGGRPIMWKSGHSYMKDKIAETGALLGGEYSGHIFFKERWFGFDDGMYAGARLVEILSTTDPDLDLQLQAFPDSISTPELKVISTETQKFSIIEQLISNADFGEGKISTLDGLRADFPDGWGLVRASNTTPMLILRFEADTEEAMQRIQQQFKQQLQSIDNTLQFNF